MPEETGQMEVVKHHTNLNLNIHEQFLMIPSEHI